MRHQGLVQAECATCGHVIAPASELVCAVSEDDVAALCEFPCPRCDRVLMLPLAPTEVSTLILLGAHKARSMPFELLEEHSGPAVSWDEILDLHLELEAQPYPQRELDRRQAA